MREKNLSKKTAKLVTGMLNNILKVEANSTTCGMVYQPKAPKTLQRFRNNK
ncbi:cyclic lactone autoinducer peptide [Eubacterium sp.]